MTVLHQTLRSSGLALCAFCLLASPATVGADETGSEKAILILDASGSM